MGTRPSTEDPTRPHCPTNYTLNSVNVRNASDGPGKGSITQLNSIDNISTCAGYCNANSICCSFEYSPTEEMCNLNMECQPILPMVEDFCFCVKEDFATGGEYITGGHNTSEGGFTIEEEFTTGEESTTAFVSTTGNGFTTWPSPTDSTTLPPSQ